MSLHTKNTRRLPPLTQDALDALTAAVPANESVSYEQAYRILAEAEDLGQPGAEDIIERLHMHGHLYEVDGQLRLTDNRLG